MNVYEAVWMESPSFSVWSLTTPGVSLCVLCKFHIGLPGRQSPLKGRLFRTLRIDSKDLTNGMPSLQKQLHLQLLPRERTPLTPTLSMNNTHREGWLLSHVPKAPEVRGRENRLILFCEINLVLNQIQWHHYNFRLSHLLTLIRETSICSR